MDCPALKSPLTPLQKRGGERKNTGDYEQSLMKHASQYTHIRSPLFEGGWGGFAFRVHFTLFSCPALKSPPNPPSKRGERKNTGDCEQSLMKHASQYTRIRSPLFEGGLGGICFEFTT